MDKDTLTELQEKFVELYCTGKYKTMKDAALAAGYGEKGIYRRVYELRRNPQVIKKIEEYQTALRDDVQKRLAFAAKEAVNVLLKVLIDPEASTKDRTIVARDLLDRAGYKPTEKTELTGALNVGLVVDDDL